MDAKNVSYLGEKPKLPKPQYWKLPVIFICNIFCNKVQRNMSKSDESRNTEGEMKFM
jgi:hypothetical protein